MEFGGKADEHALAEVMKKTFNLVKNSHDYAITSICDTAVKVAMQILAGKVMRKCRADEVPIPVIALVA